MGDRRGPPPSMDYSHYPPPPRDYDRRPPGPPGDYQRSERRPPPPVQAMRSPPRYDMRDGPGPVPPPYAYQRRDGYDDYRGPPPPMPPSSIDSRGKRRRSLSPGPPIRRGEYPPRDNYRPPPPDYRGDYAPRDYPASPPPPQGHYRGGPPGPPPSGGAYYRGGPPPSAHVDEAPHHLSYRVTHRYFSDWFTATNPPSLSSSKEALETAWKKYLAEYLRKEVKPTFDELKGMKWFEEKYGVGEGREGEREERGREGRNGRVEEWCQMAEKGEWEGVTMNFDEESAQTEGAKNSTENGDTTMKDSKDSDKKKKPDPVLGDGLLVLTPETVLIPSRPHRLVISSIPSTVAYSDLHAILSPLDGFVRLSTSDGDSTADWTRTAWSTFDTEENATKALETVSEAMIGEYKLDVKKQDQPLEVKIRAAPAAMSTPDRIKKDLEIVESVIEYLEKGEEEEKKGSEVIREMREKWTKEVEEKKDKEENTDKDQVELVRKTLDYNLHYLRFAFSTCYYCARICQSPEALEAVCPRHVRRTGPALPSDVPFVIGLDEKLPLLGDHDKLDLRDFGAELKEEVLFSLCSPYIKTEEEGKFRCKECNKLFSARKFVEKHILTKHGQFVQDALVQIEYLNNYILDPAHHPLSEFQSMNFLPSLYTPPPPPAPPLADRIGGRRSTTMNGSNGDRDGNKRQRRDGPPPPPPKGAVLDPRAARVPSSYADLDGTPGGAPDVVELPY